MDSAVVGGWGTLSWLSREVVLGERLKMEGTQGGCTVASGGWGIKFPTRKLNLTNFLPGVLLLG